MRITSLALHGFKSFGNRTTLEFAPGITAIIGPNGSGKSNIIDALRWTSGGGRAQSFRAGEKTDLIFHGASGKKPLSYAEVELELQGERRLHLSRSLFRDGQSKLKLNGKGARFLDVEAQLTGTGLGRGGLAIIGQGEVGEVLMADPEKLLSYVAEVAGVAQLGQRREQTRQRLDDARGHLARLEDLLGELRDRLERLSQEAEQAREFSALTRERLQLRYSLSVSRETRLTEEVETLGAQRDELQVTLDDGRESLAASQAAWHQARGTLQDVEEAYRKALTEAEAKRGDLRVAEAHLGALTERKAALEQQRSAQEVEISRLSALAEPEQPADDLVRLELAVSQSHEDMTRAQAAFERVQADHDALVREVEASRQAFMQARQAHVEYESKRAQLSERQGVLEAQLETLAGENKDLGEEAKVNLRARQHEWAEMEATVERGRDALVTAQAEHAEALAEQQALERSLGRLQRDLDARRGFALGPRQALQANIPGTHGAVADLLRVESEYRLAVASALGRRSEYIVVDSSATAKKVLEAVRQKGGWVTLLPLDLIEARQPGLKADFRTEAGVIGLALEKLEIDAQYRSVFAQLLGATTIVTDMDAAVALAKRHRKRPRMVTLEGDLLESYGAMSGGKRQTNAGVLGAAAELEDTAAALTEAEGLLERRKRDLQVQQQDLKALLERRQLLEQGLTALRQQVQSAEQARAARASRRELILEQIEDTRAALAKLEVPEDVPESEAVQASERLKTMQTAMEEQRRDVQDMRDAQAELQKGLLLAREQRRHYGQAIAHYRAEQGRLEDLQVQRTALTEELQASRDALEIAQQHYEQAKSALPQDLDDRKEAFERVKASVASREAELEAHSLSQAETSQALEELKVTLARREAALELAREERAAFPPGIDALELGARSCRQRLNEVESALETLGPVNHRAEEDYEGQKERLESLEVQGVEATLAVAELERVLEQIDQETKARLNTALGHLDLSFRQHVDDLFGQGAQAGLRVQREEGRPVGLSIDLQPPGKQTRSLNMLSVGERTMGALAFLFSLMSGGGGKRLPIAILDEVDAPLDEANIRRYCDFLVRLAKQGTQFILITHQKATFDVADVLWGVTTEQGVSRVFSISKKEEAVLA